MPSAVQDVFSHKAISAEAVLARAEDENSARGADGENFDVIFIIRTCPAETLLENDLCGEVEP